MAQMLAIAADYRRFMPISARSAGPMELRSATQTYVDPGGGGFPTLQYGKAVGIGPFACKSREQALVCVTKGGKGILLSVQKLKLF